MPTSIMIALSQPRSDEEDLAFNQWYDDVHLHEVVALPGVVSAARYKMVDVPLSPGIAPGTHPYLAIYELAAQSSEELQEFMGIVTAAIATGGFDMSGPIAMDNSAAILALPIGTKLMGKAS